MGRPSIVQGVVLGLLRHLVDGSWEAGTALPSTRQLAVELGVSQPTVRTALSRLARRHLVHTRPRMNAIVQSGATERAKDLLASWSRRKAVRHLAMIVPQQLLPFEPGTYWHSVTRAVLRETARNDIRTTLVPWPKKNPTEFAEHLASGRYGAALVHGTSDISLLVLQRLAALKFPVLMHNTRIPLFGLPTVLRDDRSGVRQVVSRFIEHGHRNVCLVMEDYGIFDKAPQQHVSCRTQAWKETLHESDLDRTSPVSIHILDVGHDRYRYLHNVLGSRGGPTALLFSVGHIEDIFKDPRYAGIRIPDEVSVAAFDSTYRVPLAPWRPRLTSVSVDLERMAECTVELVEAMFAGDTHPSSIRVPPRIDFTDSIGPAPTRLR